MNDKDGIKCLQPNFLKKTPKQNKENSFQMQAEYGRRTSAWSARQI